MKRPETVPAGRRPARRQESRAGAAQAGEPIACRTPRPGRPVSAQCSRRCRPRRASRPRLFPRWARVPGVQSTQGREIQKRAGAVSGVCCAPCCRGLEAPRVPPLQSRPGRGRPLAAAVWPGRWRRSPFCTGRRPAGFCAPGLSRASPGLRPQALQSLRSGCRAGRAPRAPAATLRPAPGLAQHLRRAADLQSLGGAAPRPRSPRRCRRAPMQARSLAPFHARRCERAGPTRKPQAAPRRPCRPLCTDKPPVGLHAPGWQGPPTSARQPLSRKRLPQLSLGPEAGSCAELRRARLFGSTAQQERGPGPPRGKARASACCLRDNSDAGRGLPSGLHQPSGSRADCKRRSPLAFPWAAR